MRVCSAIGDCAHGDSDGRRQIVRRKPGERAAVESEGDHPDVEHSATQPHRQRQALKPYCSPIILRDQHQLTADSAGSCYEGKESRTSLVIDRVAEKLAARPERSRTVPLVSGIRLAACVRSAVLREYR